MQADPATRLEHNKHPDAAHAQIPQRRLEPGQAVMGEASTEY